MPMPAFQKQYICNLRSCVRSVGLVIPTSQPLTPALCACGGRSVLCRRSVGTLEWDDDVDVYDCERAKDVFGAPSCLSLS